MKGGRLLTTLYLLKRVLQLYSHSSDVALERQRGQLGGPFPPSTPTELTRLAAPPTGGGHPQQRGGRQRYGVVAPLSRLTDVEARLMGRAVGRPVQLFS